jgi:hypothetical protein
MVSENPVGAGNQQERLSSEEHQGWFLAGFVEGEGSVHLALKRRPTSRFGLYVQPEFFIYQHRLRRELLEMAQRYFRAGRIRPKPGNADVLVFSIISRPDIVGKALPFLERFTAHSARRADFERFARAARLLDAGAHRTSDGLREIVSLAYAMNMNGKQRRIPLADILDRIPRGHTPDAPS